MKSDFTINYPCGNYVKRISCFDALWNEFQTVLNWEDYRNTRFEELKTTPLNWIDLTASQDAKIRNLLFDEYIKFFEQWVSEVIQKGKSKVEFHYSINIIKKE